MGKPWIEGPKLIDWIERTALHAIESCDLLPLQITLGTPSVEM